MRVVTCYLGRECPYRQLPLPPGVKRRQFPHVFATQISVPSSGFLLNFIAHAGSLKQPSSCSGMFTYSSISLHLAGPASFVVLNFSWSQTLFFFSFSFLLNRNVWQAQIVDVLPLSWEDIAADCCWVSS